MTSANARLAFVFAAIFLLALAPRLAVAVRFDDPPATTNDAGWYDFFGMQIAEGHGYSLPYGEATSRWPPGYPYFLGAIYKATGDSRAAARVAQTLLGAATAVLATEVARRVIGLRTGVVTGVIVALLPGHVLWTSVLMSEVLFTFLIAAAFAIGVRARSSWAMAAAAGVTFGAATLVRAQGAVLVPALFAWWWAAGWQRAPDRRATSLRAGALVAALALTLVPWTIRNAVELDTFAPVSTNLGVNLWMGNNPDATGGVMNAPMADIQRQTAELTNPELEVRSDALARDAALRYVAHHPLTALSRVPDKLRETYRDDSAFNDWYDPAGRNYLDGATKSRISWLTNVTYALVLAAAAAGAALLLRERSAALAMVLAAMLAWSAVSAVFFGDRRYHLPLMPLLAIPAAYALVRVFDAATTRLRLPPSSTE